MKRSFILFSFILMLPAIVLAGQANSSSSATANVGVMAGGGSASSFAEGGTAVTNTNVSPNISPNINVDVGVNPNISPSINPRQTVSPQTRSSVAIDSHDKIENINRQLPGSPLLGGPNAMEYFGPWQLPKTPWNVFSPYVGRYEVQDPAIRIEYEKLWKHFYRNYENVSSVIQVPWGSVSTQGMVLVGEMAVVLHKEQTSEDGLQIARYLASENGADLVEFTLGWNQQSEAGGWHVGTGAGATGVVGPQEKVGVSGAGGTGVGHSWVKIETCPFVKARFWRTKGQEIRIKKITLETNKSLRRNHVQEKFKTIRKEGK